MSTITRKEDMNMGERGSSGSGKEGSGGPTSPILAIRKRDSSLLGCQTAPRGRLMKGW